MASWLCFYQSLYSRFFSSCSVSYSLTPIPSSLCWAVMFIWMPSDTNVRTEALVGWVRAAFKCWEHLRASLGAMCSKRVRCTNVNKLTNNGTCSARCFVFLLWWKSWLTDQRRSLLKKSLHNSTEDLHRGKPRVIKAAGPSAKEQSVEG